MKCSVCEADINEKPLFRANKKGQPVIWKCEDCMGINNIPTDVKNITDIIKDDK